MFWILQTNQIGQVQVGIQSLPDPVPRLKSLHLLPSSRGTMTIGRATVLSAGIATILSVAFTKCYLLSAIPVFQRWKHLVRLPALIVPDIALILVIVFFTFTLFQYSRKANRTLLRFTLLFTALAFFTISSIINSISGAYFQMSGALIQWSTAFDFISDFSSSSSFFISNSGPPLFWLWMHVSLFGACMMFLWRKTFSEFYSPLSFSASSVSLKQEDVPFWKKKRFWLAVIVASIYCYWAISTGPKVGEWRALTEPQLVSFTKAIGRVVSQRYLLSAVMTSTSTHYDDCRTIRSLYEMYTKQRKTCPKYEEPDFSFLKRDQLGGIKHVIWLYIESARSDIFPFDPNSPWVKEHLRIEDRASNPISPFFTSLVERGLYFENFRTISTYTLKSLIGGLCSVIPLPLNRLPEHEHKAYRKCLPQILAENDWETIYLQPGTMDWEHQREEMYRMGFKSVVGVEEIDRGVFVGKYRSRFQEVNYFGVDDIPMINPLLEWMEENARDGRCSFASMLTNVNHDPYTCPEGWDMKSYIKDDLPAKVNAYINTARYSDNFIQKLVEALHERELMDETLLVIMGDHGMSLGEHQRVGTNEDPAEQMIKVPCLFYSENEGWAERYPPKKIKDEFSSLDVLPTIMDMLRKDGKQVPDYLFQDYYEGSSQVREAQKDPLRITLVNPGAHSQVFHQKHYKAVVKPAEDERIFYDLTKDPSEDDPKVVEELEGTSREWFESTLEFSKIFQEHIIKLWNMNMTLYHEEGAIE